MTPRADRLFGLGWTLLGFAIVVESWRMDRLEQQHINPWTVPGLLPGLLGAILVVLGVVLATRRPPPPATAQHELFGIDDPPAAAPEEEGAEPWRVGLSLLLCLGFAGELVGHGLPFWAASFIFVFLAILLFEWQDRRAAGTLLRGAAQAAAIAAGSTAVITYIFQEIFLVRLP